MPARPARTIPLSVADARRDPSHGYVLRLGQGRLDGPRGHAGFTHTS